MVTAQCRVRVELTDRKVAEIVGRPVEDTEEYRKEAEEKCREWIKDDFPTALAYADEVEVEAHTE